MRIGEVAEQAGVSVETLRYYERRGLLPEPIRSVGGHRDYDSDTVRYVRAVKETQSLGFSLAEIEEYLDLTRRDPASASAAVRERLEGKLDEVDAKVAALQTMRAGLHQALDEVWYTLGHSTSTAAYLASGGRGPELGTGPLHVTNGESVASTLRATSLERIWSSRRSLDTETALAARRWWLAVCSDETERVLGEDTSALPYLEPAMRRLVEERAQPSRTKRQLLRALAGGPKTPLQLFVANQAMEEAAFLADTWCFLLLYELAQEGHIRATGGGRVPPPPPRGDHERFATNVLELA